MDLDPEDEASPSSPCPSLFVGSLDLSVVAVWEAMAPGPQY